MNDFDCGWNHPACESLKSISPHAETLFTLKSTNSDSMPVWRRISMAGEDQFCQHCHMRLLSCEFPNFSDF